MSRLTIVKCYLDVTSGECNFIFNLPMNFQIRVCYVLEHKNNNKQKYLRKCQTQGKRKKSDIILLAIDLKTKNIWWGILISDLNMLA